MDIAKEEVDISAAMLENAPLSSAAPADGVSAGVLVGVILGVLCVIGVMFSLAVLMDRWNRRLNSTRGSRSSGRSKKTAILDDMYPSAVSDPPARSTLPPSHESC